MAGVVIPIPTFPFGYILILSIAVLLPVFPATAVQKVKLAEKLESRLLIIFAGPAGLSE